MHDVAAKRALFDGFAEIAKALASGRRAELVDVLEQGERNVDELAAAIDQTVANTSFHLRVLADAGLVTTRRSGTRIYYRLTSDRVGDLWSALRDVTTAHHERLDALAAAYVGDRESLEQITRDELVHRLADGDVVVIDVRPPAEYEAGHIPGARSVQVDALEQHLDELPADTVVVAYCRGPYCVLADDAVRALAGSGHNARRLEGGFPEWRRDGLPVEAHTPDASEAGT